MAFFRGMETITIVRKSVSGVDDFGNPTFSTTNTTLQNCGIAFGGSDEEVMDDRDPIDTTLTLYLPYGTAIEPDDVFIVRGTKFVKASSPEVWVSPFAIQELPVIQKVRRRDG
jgi:hypothetical protein